MDFKEYKGGYFKPQISYKSFSPAFINHSWIWTDPEINILLEEATLRLGELNAFSLYVPNINMYIRMHVFKEATTSSRIEGTKTEIEEALLKENDIEPEKRDDWNEVQSYVEAMNYAIKELEKLPLSNRLLRNTHKILMEGVRGKHKMPGEFRTSQNWIGGATLRDAVFIPPHYSELDELMGDLELFIHNEEIRVPHLIKIAIAHYQFETIHPFLDGNGRLGRLMITLYLVSKGLLKHPSLYLSDFFEKNKGIYYDNLMLVRTNNNITQWIKFFLVAVIETSKKGTQTFESILKLRDEIEGRRIITLGKKLPKAKELLNHLYKNPVIWPSVIAELLEVSPTTANKLTEDFEKLNILKESTGYKRNRVFIFKEYLDMFHK